MLALTTTGNLESPVNQISMSLDCGANPHRHRICKLHTDRPQTVDGYEVRTCSLWGISNRHCPTVPPSIYINIDISCFNLYIFFDNVTKTQQWSDHSMQHHTQIPGAFMRLWSPPSCLESCVCMFSYSVTMHILDLFAYCYSRTCFPTRARVHICELLYVLVSEERVY